MPDKRPAPIVDEEEQYDERLEPTREEGEKRGSVQRIGSGSKGIDHCFSRGWELGVVRSAPSDLLAEIWAGERDNRREKDFCVFWMTLSSLSFSFETCR